MRPHPDHIRAELVRRVRNGEKRCDVAVDLDVSYAYASRVCTAAGIPIVNRRKDWRRNEVVTLLKMRDAGRTHAEIAAHLNRTIASTEKALMYYKHRRADFLND